MFQPKNEEIKSKMISTSLYTIVAQDSFKILVQNQSDNK